MKTLQAETTEIRSYGDLEFVRAQGDEKRLGTVRGYAAKFNTLSEFLDGFRERILPGAFDDVLGDDVRALINHEGVPLARTKSGTLSLSVDKIGLRYEFALPDTDAAHELSEALTRGDIDQSSFRFQTVRENWDFVEDEKDGLVREIRKFTRLRDISVVTFPAYPDTAAEVRRSLDEWTNRDAAVATVYAKLAENLREI